MSPGPIQGAFPNNWALDELSGNSEFTLIGSVLWLVGNSELTGVDFSYFYSTDFGISWTKAGQYSFLQPNKTSFDPAVCHDASGFLHIIGTASVSGTDSVYKFVLDTTLRWEPNTFYPALSKIVDSNGNIQQTIGGGTSGPTEPVVWNTSGTTPDTGSPPMVWTFVQAALQGPFSVTTGEELEGDYDIVPLGNSNTLSVLSIITPDVATQLRSFEINQAGTIVQTQLIYSSASRVGSTFGAVSLVTPDGINLELYFTQHPKLLQFSDMTVLIQLANRIGGVWDVTPTTLRSIVCRQSSTKFTVISNGVLRYLTYVYYTQNRAGLAGNSLFGYRSQAGSPPVNTWAFHDFLGTPTASITEATLTVQSPGTLTLAFITRDMVAVGSPPVVPDGPVTVANLNPVNYGLTTRPDFRNPPNLSFLRGTKDIMPITGSPPEAVSWAFMGETGTGATSFYSGYNVPPVAFIQPLTVTVFRNTPATFSAAASSDANSDPIQFAWGWINAFTPGRLVFPAWQPLQAYAATIGSTIVDPNGNVQSVTTGGTSGATIPSFNPTLNGTTTDGSTSPFTAVVWTNTGNIAGIVLSPAYAPGPTLTTSQTTALTIPNSFGPSQITATLTVGAVDIGTNLLPIHFPPTGAALALSNITISNVSAPILIWPQNPINAARNTIVTLLPTLSYDPHTSPTFTWLQLSGDPVTIIGPTNSTSLRFSTAGANINGTTIVFQLTINDGVNPPLSVPTVSIIVPAYDAPGPIVLDTNVLARSNFTQPVGSPPTFIPATISQRNTPLVWGPIQKSAFFTNMDSIFRSVTLQGHDRFLSISPLSILVFDYNPELGSTPLRRLFPPTNNTTDVILDAVQTEQDYTLVLMQSQLLYRYTTAPLLNDDAPDTTLDLTTLTTFVSNSIFTTPTFGDIRVILLSGPNGLVLLEVSSDTLEVKGKLELSKEDNFVYGADNVQFVRQSNVENLSTGKVLIGTIDATGTTYETLIDLPHKVILGTWDLTKLRNVTVRSGEILFEPFSGYVGLPQAPVLNPILVNSAYDGLLSWTQERPDLVQAYVISYAISPTPFGPNPVFSPFTTISNGNIQNLTTQTPLNPTMYYLFKIHTVTADGNSPDSNIQELIPITSTPSPVLNVSLIANNYPAPKILQQATVVFQGVSTDHLTLPNPVQKGSKILFVNTSPVQTPIITDTLGNVYTSIGGAFFVTTSAVAGPLSIVYSPTGSPPVDTVTSGSVFLYEIQNGDEFTENFTAGSSGTLFVTPPYFTASTNSMEIISTRTAGVLTANPYTTGMGSTPISWTSGSPAVQNNAFFNIGEIDQQFVALYTSQFTQSGSGFWNLRGTNLSSLISGSAVLIWSQALQQNVIGYLIEEKIGAGAWTTIGTINNPVITTFSAPLAPQFFNTGVASTVFQFRVSAILTAGAGDTAPSNVVSINFPLRALISETAHVNVAFPPKNLATDGSITGAGNSPYMFLAVTSLPTGVTLSAAGILAGTSTTPLSGSPPVPNVFNWITQITDALGVVVDVVSTLTVVSP